MRISRGSFSAFRDCLHGGAGLSAFSYLNLGHFSAISLIMMDLFASRVLLRFCMVSTMSPTLAEACRVSYEDFRGTCG